MAYPKVIFGTCTCKDQGAAVATEIDQQRGALATPAPVELVQRKGRSRRNSRWMVCQRTNTPFKHGHFGYVKFSTMGSFSRTEISLNRWLPELVLPKTPSPRHMRPALEKLSMSQNVVVVWRCLDFHHEKSTRSNLLDIH